MPQENDRAGARLEHASHGRTRFRIASRRGNPEFFRGVAAVLETHPSVRQVACNPATASVLVRHDADVTPAQLFALADEQGWFTAAPPRSLGTPIEELRRFYERLEMRALRATAGRLDIESIAFVVLVLSALAGIARGDVALRSGTAIWYALELIRRPSPAERRRTGGDQDARVTADTGAAGEPNIT